MNVARNILEELKAERNSLDPSFIHCIRLLDEGNKDTDLDLMAE